MEEALRGFAGLLGLLRGAFLGLVARNGLFRVVASRALHNAGGIEEAEHAIGRLGALGDPVLRASRSITTRSAESLASIGCRCRSSR